MAEPGLRLLFLHHIRLWQRRRRVLCWVLVSRKSVVVVDFFSLTPGKLIGHRSLSIDIQRQGCVSDRCSNRYAWWSIAHDAITVGHGTRSVAIWHAFPRSSICTRCHEADVLRSRRFGRVVWTCILRVCLCMWGCRPLVLGLLDDRMPLRCDVDAALDAAPLQLQVSNIGQVVQTIVRFDLGLCE